MRWNWYAEPYHGSWRAATKPGSGHVSMHRLIMKAKPGQIVDHRDRNGLNNQRKNLRFATNQQNIANSKARPGSSRYKGVCKCRRTGKWRANIMVDARQRSLGSFKSERRAARAYDAAARVSFGEFACLNFGGAS